MDSIRVNKRPAAFLDRDGVLVRDHGYVFRLEDLEILPGVWEGLRFLHEQSYLLIVVSNQSGVARGKFSSQQVDTFHRELVAQMERVLGFSLDGIYYCPHHPEGKVPEFAIHCRCRKPDIGLLEAARQDFAIDWSRSLMIGDKDSDVECAHRAGILGIQVSSQQYESFSTPDLKIESLADLPSLWAELEKRFSRASLS